MHEIHRHIFYHLYISLLASLDQFVDLFDEQNQNSIDPFLTSYMFWWMNAYVEVRLGTVIFIYTAWLCFYTWHSGEIKRIVVQLWRKCYRLGMKWSSDGRAVHPKFWCFAASIFSVWDFYLNKL